MQILANWGLVSRLVDEPNSPFYLDWIIKIYLTYISCPPRVGGIKETCIFSTVFANLKISNFQAIFEAQLRPNIEVRIPEYTNIFPIAGGN